MKPSTPKGSPESLRARAVLVKRALWVSWGVMLAAATLGTWVWRQDLREPSVTIWLFKSLPLLAFLPGLWRGNDRSCAWLCFVVLMYFMVAVTDLMSPYAIWFNWIEMLSSVAVFVFGMLFIRWQSQANRAQAAQQNQEDAG